MKDLMKIKVLRAFYRSDIGFHKEGAIVEVAKVIAEELIKKEAAKAVSDVETSARGSKSAKPDAGRSDASRSA